MQYMHPDCRALMIRDENRHFYLRDTDSGKFWSPGWYPALTPLDNYSCRHGLGYSVVNSLFDGIEISLRLFVPRKGPCEIWTLAVKNTSGSKRNIQSFAFADWLLTGYPQYCDYHSNLHCEYDDKNNILMCWNDSAERVAHEFFNGFIASDLKPAGFDSSRKAFIGYGQVDRPQAIVADGKCKNSIGVCEKLVGVLEHVFELEPDQEKSVNIIIGAADSLRFAQDLAENIFAPGNIEREFEAVRDGIRKSYDNVRFNIPDKRVENLFNNWIKRAVQLHTEVGTDTGKGLRDVLQAAWAVSSYDYSGAKAKIIECLRHQFADGHTLRGWNPVDDHYYSDGPVWIAPAVDSYLKETRDFDFLNIIVPYFDEGEGTVWEHVIQSIRKSTDDLGPRGFIKARWGDWNDSLNMIGGRDGLGDGESVWTTIGMVFSVNCALDIVKNALKDSALERELLERRGRLTKIINEKGWDGDWYLQRPGRKGGHPYGNRRSRVPQRPNLGHPLRHRPRRTAYRVP
jgi:cellobiose phosphorylase